MQNVAKILVWPTEVQCAEKRGPVGIEPRSDGAIRWGMVVTFIPILSSTTENNGIFDENNDAMPE
jgi:hypothetical protein